MKKQRGPCTVGVIDLTEDDDSDQKPRSYTGKDGVDVEAVD